MFVYDAYNCEGGKTFSDLEVTGRTMVLEPKYDGFRLICHVTDTGVEMYTRALKRQDGKLPHVEAELLATFPAGTVLDGEIVNMVRHPDGRIENKFEDVQSVMLSKPDLAVLKGQVTKLQYIVFDVTYDSGVDLRHQPLSKRTDVLEQRMEANPDRKYVELTPRFDATQETHDVLVAMGFEGSIVKFDDTPYLSGKRGKGWYKFKHQLEIDVIVTGYTPGRGKFAGLIGAVQFGQPDENGDIVERGQCSGMDDAERAEMTGRMMRGETGYVITVAHMGTAATKAGGSVKLRHPQFKRFRPDKPAHEVIWHDE